MPARLAPYLVSRNGEVKFTQSPSPPKLQTMVGPITPHLRDTPPQLAAAVHRKRAKFDGLRQPVPDELVLLNKIATALADTAPMKQRLTSNIWLLGLMGVTMPQPKLCQYKYFTCTKGIEDKFIATKTAGYAAAWNWQEHHSCCIHTCQKRYTTNIRLHEWSGCLDSHAPFLEGADHRGTELRGRP